MAMATLELKVRIVKSQLFRRFKKALKTENKKVLRNLSDRVLFEVKISQHNFSYKLVKILRGKWDVAAGTVVIT